MRGGWAGMRSVLAGPVGGNSVGQARWWGRGSTVDEAGVEGGRCGGSPPAQGRAEGPTAQNCSG